VVPAICGELEPFAKVREDDGLANEPIGIGFAEREGLLADCSSGPKGPVHDEQDQGVLQDENVA
jgi:hypothetical protein